MCNRLKFHKIQSSHRLFLWKAILCQSDVKIFIIENLNQFTINAILNMLITVSENTEFAISTVNILLYRICKCYNLQNLYRNYLYAIR